MRDERKEGANLINPDCLQGNDFLNKFIELYKNMENTGLSRVQILRMIATQDFVKDFVDTPIWLVSAKKLPKGHKWSEGKKFHRKSGGKWGEETYVFLIIEDDLYIKGMLDGLYEFYDKSESSEYGSMKLISIRDKRICVIKNWKNIKSHEVTYRLDGVSPFFENCIHDFWHDNGGKMSYQEDNEIADFLSKKMFGGDTLE